MPASRLVEISTAPVRTRRRSDALEEGRAEMRDLLRQAGETGKVIELTLGPDERDETIKIQYRAVAKEAETTIRFKTARQRPYRNSRGKEEHEAEVLLVFVTPPAPVPTARQPRRRKVATGA